MKYSVCIFDFDLTLADSSVGIIECFKYTLDKFGYPPKDDKSIFDTIGMTLEDAFDELTGIKNNPDRSEMRKIYVKKADEVMALKTRFYDDTLAILQILQNAGVKVGIVSTKYAYRIEETFNAHTSSMPVDIIVGGSDVKKAKPDPEGLLKAIEMLKEPLDKVLYVGDSYIDAQTALNAGVDFAGVTTGSTTKKDFEKFPNIYIGENLMDIFYNINKM